MKNTLLFILASLALIGCATTEENNLTYKERRAQMCEEKPAFCRQPCSRIIKSESGRIQLVCN